MEDFMAELKRQRIWFLWQWKSNKTGKPTKVPVSAHGGPTGTSEEWSHTWVTYDDAIAAVETQHTAGVGFKVPEGYFFFDAVIDELFRQSALYREKWERQDYREATIQCGIEACGGEYHRSQMPHPYFIKFNEETGQPYVSVPLLARYVREHLCYVLVRDNGKQGLLKYVYEDGCYRLYSSDMFLGVIKRYIADYDEELVKMSKVNEVLQHISTDLSYVSQDDLNCEEDIINFRNGLLKVTATETTLLTHSPSLLSTIQIPCDWHGEETPTPIFDRYLHSLTNGDSAVRRLLLEFIGVCMGIASLLSPGGG